jgi:hypothetical protein
MQHIKQVKDKQKLNIPSIRSFSFVNNDSFSKFSFFFMDDRSTVRWQQEEKWEWKIKVKI